MNKFEIAKDLYRQNIYNVNIGDGHYSHLTCYFTGKYEEEKNLLFIFKAGYNTNMTNFEENTDLIPLKLPKEILEVCKNVLSSWTYDHIDPVELYKHPPLYAGIFEITKRDEFVLSKLENEK